MPIPDNEGAELMTDALKRGASIQDIAAAFLQPMEPLATYHADRPLYQTPLGLNFDKAWIKGAKDLLRKQMTQAPGDIQFVEPEKAWEAAEARTLDLADWEKDIVMCTL